MAIDVAKRALADGRQRLLSGRDSTMGNTLLGTLRKVAIGGARPVAVMLLIVATLVTSIRSCGTPPSEQSLIEGFYAHRPAFEHLRDMLLVDQRVVRIANWGGETTTHVVAQIPPDGDFPADRYKEYLAGLKAVGGKVAGRGTGESADIWVGVWSFGWAGDRRQVSICWKQVPPANQVASLDVYHNDRDHKQPHGAYRHIDGNWYLWGDW